MNNEMIALANQLRDKVIELIYNTELVNDRKRNDMLLMIDNMFKETQTDIERFIPLLMMEEYVKAVAEATGLLNERRTDIRRIANTNQLKRIANDTMLDLRAAYRTAQRNTVASIDVTMQQVKQELFDGVLDGKNRQYIANRVAERFNEAGMISFITKDGKRLPLDFYSQTVVNTKRRDSSIQGHIDRYMQSGQDLVEVVGVWPTCSHCKSVRGMVFSLTGETEDFPLLRDEFKPPYHPNCRCTLRPVILQFMTDTEIKKIKERNASHDAAKDIRSTSEREEYEKEQSENRKRNVEKKQYAEMVAILGDDAPATLGAFRRMKRQNTTNYQELLIQMREQRNFIK